MVGLLNIKRMTNKQRLEACKELAHKLAYEYLNKATEEQKAIFFDNYNQTK